MKVEKNRKNKEEVKKYLTIEPVSKKNNGDSFQFSQLDKKSFCQTNV